MSPLFGRRRARQERPHPYADELTSTWETRVDARVVTLVWLGVSTLLAVGGYLLQVRYGYINNQVTQHPDWETWTNVPLFAGLALLGFGFVRRRWAHWLTMAGWVLFAAYWGLTARDLLITEGQDYVNFIFAMVGVYFFCYLAYHEWLSLARRVENGAVRFLNVTAFIAAGTYFLIAKVTVLRVALIEIVGRHTKWMLDLFGHGDKQGLQFVIDRQDTDGPVTFWYPDTYCDPTRGDAIGDYCRENGIATTHTYPDPPSNGFESLLQYSPDNDLLIIPVSIILACTAIQSIMLFVGLFAGADAHWKKKLYASLIVGALVYVLNLVRNTGIIWLYGRGHASFWVMHNAVGKGGSLIAMILIAFAVFRYFPEFLRSLIGVLDLQHRDGPIERALKLGRQRPDIDAAIAAGTAGAAAGAGGAAAESAGTGMARHEHGPAAPPSDSEE